MFAAAAALVAANSPLSDDYFALLHVRLLGMDVLHWINDGLMALFFLLVGLEIKRELLEGELSTWPRRMLPGIAAAGGMAVPAVVYLAFNAGHPENWRGWAIPAATDIAFALGVLSLLSTRVPTSLKVFLTALAILDDLGAVIIIAAFYTAELSVVFVGLAAVILGGLYVMNRLGVVGLAPYLAAGLALWLFVLNSGIHATLAGVALALLMPLRTSSDDRSPVRRLEHILGPIVAFGVVPIFGFANAGVSVLTSSTAVALSPIAIGIAAGLFVGKQIGVFGAAWLAVKFGVARLPAHASWQQFYGVALLCGIGFTMSLFIGNLAFGNPEVQDTVKIGILAGSFISAICGWLVIRLTPAR